MCISLSVLQAISALASFNVLLCYRDNLTKLEVNMLWVYLTHLIAESSLNRIFQQNSPNDRLKPDTDLIRRYETHFLPSTEFIFAASATRYTTMMFFAIYNTMQLYVNMFCSERRASAFSRKVEKIGITIFIREWSLIKYTLQAHFEIVVLAEARLKLKLNSSILICLIATQYYKARG